MDTFIRLSDDFHAYDIRRDQIVAISQARTSSQPAVTVYLKGGGQFSVRETAREILALLDTGAEG